jgi:multiple sugar transport system ATP-binding protein
MIYVTHDQVEAMTMGDRIVVMRDGYIQQVAEPGVLYDSPANRFVAGFIGTPPMNFFEGKLAGRNGRLGFVAGAFEIEVPREWAEPLRANAGQDVTFGIRPEDIGSTRARSRPDAPKIPATVEVVEPMGSETYLYLTTGGDTFIARVDAHDTSAVGEKLELPLSMDKAQFFDKQNENVIDLPRG